MSASEDFSCTPPEIRALADNTLGNLLPTKSRESYEKKYTEFQTWRADNKIVTISETVLLAYFEVQRKKYKSSSLWTLYSKLRSCLSVYENVDISKFHKLQALLKRCSEGYAPKKSKILEEDEINKFIDDADDNMYMAMKVILICGYSGALRREELTYLSTDNIKYNSDSILINIPKTKNNVPREFMITDPKWINLIKKYAALRPKTTTHTRFFITYRNGRCTNSPIGINTMGKVSKQIATFLRLPEPELFTGHCFRRSSATQLANRGGDLMTLKRHGGWKSSAVAEGYVEATLKKKEEIADLLRPQHVNLPSSSHASEMDSVPTTSASGSGSRVQHNYLMNENFRGVSIDSHDTSNVIVNVYNNCTFYGHTSSSS